MNEIRRGITTPGKHRPRGNGNEVLLHIPQSSTAQSAGAVEYTDGISAEG